MILIVDNFDSFTHNLVDYFQQLDQDYTLVKNNVSVEELEGIVFDSIVLSPGPGTPKKAGRLLKIVEVFHSRVPFLGICLGHQALCEFFGGEIRKAQKPMHGKISSVNRRDNVVFEGVPEHFKVVRYHSLVACELPVCLEDIAHSESGEIMAVRHKSLPIWGIQFHPEAALTEYGILVLKNWLKATNQVN